MDIGPLLLALALLLLVVAFVARPFMDRATGPGQQAATSDLVTQREATLIELRELDFDYSTGKLAEADYQTQRARLVAKGAEILRAIDQLPSPNAPVSAANPLDDEIEQLIAARRHAQPAANTASPKSPRCPKCHKPIQAADKFCPSCGAKLA